MAGLRASRVSASLRNASVTTAPTKTAQRDPGGRPRFSGGEEVIPDTMRLGLCLSIVGIAAEFHHNHRSACGKGERVTPLCPQVDVVVGVHVPARPSPGARNLVRRRVPIETLPALAALCQERSVYT